jgi:hypothetical protein
MGKPLVEHHVDEPLDGSGARFARQMRTTQGGNDFLLISFLMFRCIAALTAGWGSPYTPVVSALSATMLIGE